MHAETLARKLPSDIGDTCLASILLTGSTPAPHDPRRPSASPLAAEGRALAPWLAPLSIRGVTASPHSMAVHSLSRVGALADI